MESTRSLDSTGNFRLRNFASIHGEIKMQGTITLCTLDGCNLAPIPTSHIFMIIFAVFFSII
jgi:hypothetical protein